jgi:HD-GYP domain-containing protein (c-di-GMP phosphodiesterase class II)
LRIAGLLHDIGKIEYRKQCLLKPDKLTDEEYKIIMTHPSVGADIIKNIRGIERIESSIRHHHERIDGRGYPDGLMEKKFHFFQRLLLLLILTMQ